MSQIVAKEPKTPLVAHVTVPLKDRTETVARLQKISLSRLVTVALTEHFARLGVA